MNNLLTSQGEFRGDFTRDTYDPFKRFSRVLLQQGRVLLDADWNEQTSILLHYFRRLAADVIGEHGGPEGAFAIGTEAAALGISQAEFDELELKPGDFIISKGHYYVGGVLCENERHLTYSTQPDNPGTKLPGVKAATTFLVYLDVWERHVNFIQDANADNPGIREVALGGVDTATRARVVWQVRTLESKLKANDVAKYPKFIDELDDLARPGTGFLQARARKTAADNEDCACVTSPESRFRGVENQLYRVEIHRAGGAWNGIVEKKKGEPAGNADKAATFKWSRENSSVDFAIRLPVDSGNGITTASLVQLGRDARHSLDEGDWVELIDDDHLLQSNPGNLLRVKAIDRDQGTVTLEGMPTGPVGQDTAKHPLLRRWNHRAGNPKNGGLTLHTDGGALVQESADDSGWLTLENGVQIRFQSHAPKARYAPGDYWLIPARVATGDVEWPGSSNNPAWLPPHGPQHFYAPLAIITLDNSGKVMTENCRRVIKPIAS